MSDVFREVREPHTGRLLFRYDATRQLVEVQLRRVKTLIDLAEYRHAEQEPLDSVCEYGRMIEDE